MKPFNLEAALRGEPVVTRDGRTVLGIHQFKNQSHTRNVYFEVLDTQGKVSVFDVYPDGFERGKSLPRSLDIFMAPKKVTRWVLLYEHSTVFGTAIYAVNFPTKDEANRWKAATDTVYTFFGEPQAYEYEE